MLSMTTSSAVARRYTLIPDPATSSSKVAPVRRLRLARFQPEPQGAPGVERYSYLKRLYD
jgi:hypothetical protein